MSAVVEVTPSESMGSVKLHLIETSEDAMEFIRWIGQRRPNNAIAIDTETGELPGNPRGDALSPYKGRLRLVQVGDAMEAWAIPWDQWKGVFYEAMEKYDGQIICHNIAFEAKWFAVQSDWQFPWERSHDTMIMAHIVNPLGAGGLKPLASLYVDNRAAQLQGQLDDTLRENGWTWGSVPVKFDPYWSYGALDCILTTRLWEKFYAECGPGGSYNRAYELEMNVRRIATRMELNGARIDLDYSQKKFDELTAYTESVKSWAKDTYGSSFSITSNIQLARKLEELGAEFSMFTNSGQKSADKDQLALFINTGNDEVRNLSDIVLKQRKADKLANTYFANFLTDSINGVVHPSIRTLGARTSRMSIADPALQTLPKGDATVRRAFIPKDEDHVIITSDLDQVEFRLFASLSQDPNLIALFNNADAIGSDPFTEIGREIYKDPSMQKSDKRRNLIKGTIYGRLYGAGVAKQAETAGVPREQMQIVSDAFDTRFPGMASFQKAIDDIGMRRFRDEGEGYVLTWTGRRLPCDDDRVYTLTNYLIQGSAAEIFKSNLVKLDQADLTELMIVPVHDEIVLNAPRSDVEEVKRLVQQCMTTTEGWAIPLTSGIDGPMENWGEKYA